MSSWDTGLLRMPRLHYDNKEPVFHVAKRTVGRRAISFVNVPWYLVQPINTIIIRLFESGILQRYEEFIGFMFELRHGKGSSNAKEMYDDSYAFIWFGLAGAAIVSVAVFVAELLVFRMGRKLET